jgi:hypothetical protein
MGIAASQFDLVCLHDKLAVRPKALLNWWSDRRQYSKPSAFP